MTVSTILMVVVERRLCDSGLWKAVILKSDAISDYNWTIPKSFDEVV